MRVIERLNWFSLAVIVLEASALLALYVLLRVRSAPIRRPLQFIWLVFVVRFVLYATPITWFVYFLALGEPEIDWRDRDVIANKVKSFLRPEADSPYVMVGSSQTWAIYADFARTHPAIEPYYVAGMAPIDFIEEYPRIRALNPKRIVLFISEFDLARPINLAGVIESNLELTDLLNFYSTIAPVVSSSRAQEAVIQKAFANIFPEFQYRFVSVGFARLAARHLPIFEQPAPPTNMIAVQAASLLKLDAAYVKPQEYLLDNFLERADRDNIKVTIVEGQYNPDAYSAENIDIHNNIVMPYIYSIPARFPNVDLILRSQTGEFAATDYNDMYHVSKPAGSLFAARVLKILSERDRTATSDTPSSQ